MKFFLKTFVFCLMLLITSGNAVICAPVASPAAQASVAKQATPDYTMLRTPTLIVDNPHAYLNKYVEFPARFNKFSTLGLDYTPAKRESQIYIGVLIERDDAGNNVIPLSELKLFIKRTEAEKLTDLESGDNILIKGKVFSTALGDPWMDILELKILTPKDKSKQSK